MPKNNVSMPAVSVTMCTNVCDRFFDLALASIEKQSFSDFEVVIVANGMDDAAFQDLVQRASDPRCRVFRAAVQGVTFSRNLALEHARAPLVAVMDADDISYPARLERQVAYFTKYPETAVCGSAFEEIDADENTLGLHLRPLTDRDIRRTLTWTNPFCHPTTMMRTDAVRLAGGYGGYHAEDYELWLRLAEQPGSIFANLPEPLVGYRVPVMSLARRSKRAYAQVAGLLFRSFVIDKQPRWLLSALITAAKAWFRASRA